MKKQYLLSILTALPLILSAGTPAVAAVGSGDAPIRFAKISVQASKHFQEQQPDGTYAYKIESICERTGEVPVFSSTTTDQPQIDPAKFISCDANLKVGPSRLMISGFVMELKNADVFGDGQRGDYKSFFSSTWVQSKSGTFVKALPYSIAASEANTRMMILTQWGENLSSDQNGDRVLDERVHVTIKFED